MRLDRIRDALENKRLAIGVHCEDRDPSYYEMAAAMGYDYIWIDNEHSYISGETTFNGVVTANACGSAAFVRVGDNTVSTTKHILDMGADGLIFPNISTPQEAEQCIKVCTYPPKGVRGYGAWRPTNYGTMPLDEYMKNVDDSVMKLIMIESEKGVENLDEILEVPGIDVIICGPMDLSASVGKLGQLKDPQVVEMMQKIGRKCSAAGIPFGLSVGYNCELVRFWVELGASFITMGSADHYFSMMARDSLRRIKDIEAEVRGK